VRPLLGRLALVPVTLVGVSAITFALMHLAPGDPALVRAGEGRGVTPELVAENRALLGLDRPLGARYLRWLGRSAELDFGVSPVDGRPVRARIAEALPATAVLGLLAALMAIALALPLGVFAAAREGSRAARALEAALAVGYGVPVVAVALALLRAGAPYGGAGAGLIAPAACLALPSAIVLARQTRSALLAVLGADFVRTARAKGASPGLALRRHALRAALLPLVTLVGAQVPVLLSGSVLVERIFGVHGLGLLGYEAVLARDYPTLMALSTLAAALAIAGVLVADAACLLLDPRLRPAPEEPRP
jgi:ABC-type dipeptide/oligopeptide/nickel transport system permease component